uniref:Uncharacterized protein n=1 Tax=Tetradesmus obliquus TaxID=3088 RepID=A0A383WAR4_TETOB
MGHKGARTAQDSTGWRLPQQQRQGPADAEHQAYGGISSRQQQQLHADKQQQHVRLQVQQQRQGAADAEHQAHGGISSRQQQPHADKQQHKDCMCSSSAKGQQMQSIKPLRHKQPAAAAAACVAAAAAQDCRCSSS